MGILHILDTNKVRVFEDIFVLDANSGLYTIQEPSNHHNINVILG